MELQIAYFGLSTFHASRQENPVLYYHTQEKELFIMLHQNNWKRKNIIQKLTFTLWEYFHAILC